MATQEPDFNEESNRHSTDLFIRDSHVVTIDLTELQRAQLLQSLLTIFVLQGRLKPAARGDGRLPSILRHPRRLLDPEEQDIEVNPVLQGQSIRIENGKNVMFKDCSEATGR